MGGARFDDIIIGAGILGLAHAYHLSRRGRRVVVLERNRMAFGASVRNFGMLWPIGQPFGPMRDLARRSLETWQELLEAAGLPCDRCGSLHLAYHEDEAQVLSEYADRSRTAGFPVEVLTPDRVDRRSRVVRREGLRAALWSPEETYVDPRRIIPELASWLERAGEVAFHFRCAATAVEPGKVWAGGETWSAGRVWICSGDDLETLFPLELSSTGAFRCKLQMMSAKPPTPEWRLGPMLAAGLTLRHYRSFADCPSLAAVKERISRESPWFDRYGIHVLVSQNSEGDLMLGDSHEYGDQIDPFDKAEIEDVILAYLKLFLEYPEPRIVSRWQGTYLKHPELPSIDLQPAPGVSLFTGVGGGGMTLSFALAEQSVRRELGEAEA